MLKSTFILIYHILEASLNIYMLIWDIIIDESMAFFQNFCYLTILTHTLLCIFCLLIIDCDIAIIKSNSSKDKLRYPPYIYKFYQTLQGIGGVVMIGYWGLRLFRRELLFPENYNPVPEILASYTHGGNYLVLFMEIFMFEHVIYHDTGKKIRNFLFFQLFYLFIQFLHWVNYGTHVYPFIKHLNYLQLSGFYLILFSFSCFWDFILCKMFIKRKWDDIDINEKYK